MATEARAVACPVCGESFAAPTARCFRCETDLSSWWPLEESLEALARIPTDVAPAATSEEAPRGPRRRRRQRGWVVPVLLMGGLLVALFLHLESTRSPEGSPAPSDGPRAVARRAVSPPAVPGSEPTPRATLRYVVQPGDSLWRIAAALKGDGRRWPELLVEGDGVDPAGLRPGQVLRLHLGDEAPPLRGPSISQP